MSKLYLGLIVIRSIYYLIMLIFRRQKSRSTWIVICIIQGLISLSIIFVLTLRFSLFRYRFAAIDYPYLAHQIDSDVLYLLHFFVPSSFLFIGFWIFMLKFVLHKNTLFNESIWGMILAELLFYTYKVSEIVLINDSLVSCDEFILGKHSGCYIPN
jgi:predicted ferric reductase